MALPQARGSPTRVFVEELCSKTHWTEASFRSWMFNLILLSILAALAQYLVPPFSLQSNLKPHFLSFVFCPPIFTLYLLLMQFLLFLTPFTHHPGHLLHQSVWWQARTKRHHPCSWVSRPCPRSLGKSHLISHNPSWSTPSTNQYLQGSQPSNPSRSPMQNAIFQLLNALFCWGSSRQGREKGKQPLGKPAPAKFPIISTARQCQDFTQKS